jgi:hypothetical protein
VVGNGPPYEEPNRIRKTKTNREYIRGIGVKSLRYRWEQRYRRVKLGEHQ